MDTARFRSLRENAASFVLLPPERELVGTVFGYPLYVDPTCSPDHVRVLKDGRLVGAFRIPSSEKGG